MARILLADDDVASLDVMDATLTAEGHEVSCATDGHQAYETALAEHPDLVLLDEVMPIFDGYEVCAMIRTDPESPSTLPIIMLTTAQQDRRRLDQAGATDLFPKHCGLAEMRDLLVAHLGPLANTDEEEE